MASENIISELEHKNRLLIEQLNSLRAQHLQNDAKTRNQVMSAKHKLNSIANTINQLFADIAIVQADLDEIMPSTEIIKRFAHSKELVSTVGDKTTSSVQPSDTPFSQNINSTSTISLKCSSRLPDERMLVSAQTYDPERCEVAASLLPVVLVEDNGTDVQETDTRHLSNDLSFVKDNEYNKSVTPGLDIDISRQETSPCERQTQLNISHHRKTKSRTSPSVSSTLLLQSGEKCLLPMEADASSKASFSSCQPQTSNFEMEKSTVKNFETPGVISPPSQGEEMCVQASQSTNHSLIKIAEIIPGLCSNIQLIAEIANKTLLLSETMELTCKSDTNLNLSLKSFVKNNDAPHEFAASKLFPDVPSALLSKSFLLNETMVLSDEVATHSETEDDKMICTERSKIRIAEEQLAIAEPTSSMDVQGNEARPKRQKKSVNYKEASLKKKMRR